MSHCHAKPKRLLMAKIGSLSKIIFFSPSKLVVLEVLVTLFNTGISMDGLREV